MARVAPSSTSLYGQTLTFALTTLASPIRQKSAMTTPSARKALAPMTDFLPITASFTTAPGPISYAVFCLKKKRDRGTRNVELKTFVTKPTDVQRKRLMIDTIDLPRRHLRS